MWQYMLLVIVINNDECCWINFAEGWTMMLAGGKMIKDCLLTGYCCPVFTEMNEPLG